MKSTLIKDTTKSERIQLVKQDYIDGVKEIAEVNAEFNARYISEIPDEDSGMSCGMGMRR